MLSHKQYKVLKLINKNAKNNKHGDDYLFKKIKYKKSTLNTILVTLEDNGYIVDIFNNIPNNLNSIDITEKGEDAIQDYWKYYIKIFLSKIFWLIFGSIITIIIQYILKFMWVNKLIYKYLVSYQKS